MPEFEAFPKIPRLRRDIVITEKIDGTNAAIGITADGEVYAQSRKRIITPEDDNFGFARWVSDNADTIAETLGVGLHFGEWWGAGIQRGYGLDRKVFSLFNTQRWADLPIGEDAEVVGRVPELYVGQQGDAAIEGALDLLRSHGSIAADGFDKPEGIVVYHAAARQMFKVLLENDELPKGLAA